MNNKTIPLLYLLGAGRSGTTLIATVLGNQPKIQAVGEMHQFQEHLLNNKNCSCGELLEDCVFWEPILNYLDLNLIDLQRNSQKEKHSNILKLMLTRRADKEYIALQEDIYRGILNSNSESWILDSSKYISRYLLLSKSKLFNIKGLYVVRDVRGVINSFKKQVQTPKRPLSTILYYVLINSFGQLVCWTDKRVIKIKYEDFIKQPDKMVGKILTHITQTDDSRKKPVVPSEFHVPHIIGGNRLKAKSSIVIKPDLEWKNKIPRVVQIVYYFLVFPIMVINKYKI
jgi:hypothetical protein